MNIKKIEQWIGIFLVVFAIGFNLWVFRMETAALIDPNDNTFQFALVERTNRIWDYAGKTCSGITKPLCALGYLTDHWVPNWAEGYNLPYYYSHLPQVAITASWRMLSSLNTQYSLFTHYHWVIYLLLCLFPLSVFLAVRTIGFSYAISGLASLIASHLSTDGLYGLDPSSFLWRGFGLSSQLFAMIWLPLALAHAYTYFVRDADKKSSVAGMMPAIMFLALTTAGHLGMGIITFLSVGILAISPYIQAIAAGKWTPTATRGIVPTILKLAAVFGTVGLLLGYWIIPILTDGNYHNISVWDGIWKFNSFGYREVLTNLINGALFDFGRWPILTVLIMIGLFAGATDRQFAFSLLFFFWILMYFGRTTWGGLFNLIPGMSEFHLSRFIVGVHIAGLFLIPIGIDRLITAFSSFVKNTRRSSAPSFSSHPLFSFLLYGVVVVVFVGSVYPQTVRYAAHNDVLIERANNNAVRDEQDIRNLFDTLNKAMISRPGRVFAGRGGSWGKNFRIAETPIYMHLSTYGLPVILWLPETWSPNSDTEQYFSEATLDHYILYNVRYIVTPIDLAKDQIQPFWTPLATGKTWKLYEVKRNENNENDKNDTGYITTGMLPAVVSSNKEHFRSVVRLWMHSGYPNAQVYPELTFDPAYPKTTGLPNFRMLDESIYAVPDGSEHNLFAETPRYVSPSTDLPVVISQSGTDDMTFKATVTVKNACPDCVVILRETFHPSWHVTIDGEPVEPFAVFPFFTAVRVETQGTHEITFSYRPSWIKQFLLLVSLCAIGCILWFAGRTIRKPH